MKESKEMCGRKELLLAYAPLLVPAQASFAEQIWKNNG